MDLRGFPNENKLLLIINRVGNVGKTSKLIFFQRIQIIWGKKYIIKFLCGSVVESKILTWESFNDKTGYVQSQ